MARYTTEKEFSFGPYPRDRRISVKANGGTLIVAVWDGQEYIDDTDDTITKDTNTFIDTQNCNIKLTPTGGATYFIDEVSTWV